VPTSIDPRRRRRAGLAALFGLLASPGCGGAVDRLPLHPATGKVVIDGEPEPGVQIRLHPADKLNDASALQPFAVSDAEGAFRLGTYEEGDGAPAGRYKATLFWPEKPPGPERPVDLLQGRYNDASRSELDVTIAEGENALKPFEATKPEKPAAPRRKPARPAQRDVDGLGEG
jgi:hypothetical protein